MPQMFISHILNCFYSFSSLYDVKSHKLSSISCEWRARSSTGGGSPLNYWNSTTVISCQ
uniref:Uncharacterized protein n=1 Tax=Xenopus tropicalis TaxID=8364 RepID=A0A1B8XSQ1_XENTR